MKKKIFIFIILLIVFPAVAAYAIDIVALDKVNVLMSREKVLTILGQPAEKVGSTNGLTVEVYQVSNALPLISSGCIYDSKENLVGQSFVFQGKIEKEIIHRLKIRGYISLSIKDNISRLAGFDDDTGHPLVAVIERHENLTTITTFEKSFYESRVK
ncbi:MAG: hypothetical protein ABFD50_10555 [Smithella sp.]